MPLHDRTPSSLTRRRLLAGAAPAALLLASPAYPAPLVGPGPGKAAVPQAASAVPLSAVRLLPSPYLTALDANRAYLMRLEPDRLLHNFLNQAGLPPKAPAYGGWEADTIAGHTLGHYMSALALMHAQTGDAECRRRLVYIIAELARAQAPDGFVAGFTRKIGDTVEPGRVVFDEVRRGDIRSRGFDLNGCWVPLYTWHKLFAGLLDAQAYAGLDGGIAVATRLAGYIDGVFANLTDGQIQQVLACEHGGIMESLAELSARTGNPRWLALSRTLYHRAVLEPLSREEDCLPNIHANTQIPKLIGLARLYELTGDAGYGRAARFFWETVTAHHSYVIGGNADREYFQARDSIAQHITEQTCEACNTYNMLKLTRHLYAGMGDARYFDYYERAHLNHILAHQNPATGMFAYMTPLMSGSAREYSTPFDDFWCCVGSGMESHAKHGESIYWQTGDDTLIVNLYIPSTLTWRPAGGRPAGGRPAGGRHAGQRAGLDLRLDTRYPYADTITLTVTGASSGAAKPVTLALRVPGWCPDPALALNGQAVAAAPQGGYLRLSRVWAVGDTLTLTLPRRLRLEATNDDPDTVALLYGPLVLAGDLGPADQPWTGLPPVLVGDDILGVVRPVGERAVFQTAALGMQGGAGGGEGDLTLSPFAFQHERRSAVYFRRFTPARWQAEQAAFQEAQVQAQALQARSADVIHLGEMQAERAHDLDASISYPVVYRGRNGRDARSGGYFEFTARCRPGPLSLRASYWGEERNRRFTILVDGVVVARESLDGTHPGVFFERDYPIPEALTQGRQSVRVRVEPEAGVSAGPVFGMLVLAS